jgi:aspartate carbamoyltransferase catalytic subunit
MPRHIVSASDLAPPELVRLFEQAAHYKKNGVKGKPLAGQILATLFYEPSTRTRLSFESAMKRLGGEVLVTDNAREFSSAAKGETLEDTVRTVGQYADIIALRHPENGSAKQAAAASPVPLINAGDGSNQHPTQAYLDLFTIWEAARDRFPKKPIRVFFLGDNKHSRTVNSLCLLFATRARQLGLNILDVTFSGLPNYRKPTEETLRALRQAGIPTHISKEFGHNYDVVYITRPQTERHRESEKNVVRVYSPHSHLPEHAIIMHPLPRTTELPVQVDRDPRAWYFKQVENGLYIRMALLKFLLTK